METIGKRQVSFDVLKALAMFLVLWGHCIQYFLTAEYFNDSLYRFIYSFHMPLFMMISGYFSLKAFGLDIRQFLIKKSRELILPFFTWSSILLLLIILLYIFTYSITSLSLNVFSTNLWFLKSLFFCYCIAFCCFRSCRFSFVLVSLTLFISQCITLDNICNMYPAFISGIYLNKYKEVFLKRIDVFLSVITGTLFFTMVCFWDSSYWNLPSIIEEIGRGDSLTILDLLYRRLFIIVIGLSGSTFFIIIINRICSKYAHSHRLLEGVFSTVAMFGKYTLGCYCLQSIVITNLGAIIKLDNMNSIYFHYLFSPLVSLLFYLLFFLFIKLSYKYKTLSFILWGKTY